MFVWILVIYVFEKCVYFLTKTCLQNSPEFKFCNNGFCYIIFLKKIMCSLSFLASYHFFIHLFKGQTIKFLFLLLFSYLVFFLSDLFQYNNIIIDYGLTE